MIYTQFPLGQVVMTQGISIMQNDGTGETANAIMALLNRYGRKDWGDTHQDKRANMDDWRMNDEAVENGEDRIVAKYPLDDDNIFIITEGIGEDRYTTIMYCSEY